MSAASKKDSSVRRWIALCTMLTGLILIYTGNQLGGIPETTDSPFSPARPENHSLWLMITGAAASVAGFVGLLRPRSL